MRYSYFTHLSILVISSVLVAPGLMADTSSQSSGGVKNLINRYEKLSKPQEVRTLTVRFKDMADLLGKIRDTETYIVVMGKDLKDLSKRLKIAKKLEYHPQEMSGADLRQEVNNLALTGLTIFKVDRIMGGGAKAAPIKGKAEPIVKVLKFKSMEELKSQIMPEKRYLVMKGKDFTALNRVDIQSTLRYDEQELSGEELLHDIDMLHASGVSIYGVREIS